MTEGQGVNPMPDLFLKKERMNIGYIKDALKKCYRT